ncbi:MAG: dienelactone hydrolase [Planctomycetota bacterium]
MRLIFVVSLLIGLSSDRFSRADDYAPLRLAHEDEVQTTDLSVRDAARDREIPLRIYLPPKSATQPEPAPVVLFSHGLGGNREGSAFLGKHWAARGYVAVFLQHPGSDDSVWKDQPLARRMAAMQQAASLQNFLLRVQDVPAVLDQLAKWSAESGHALAGQLDLTRVGMSGHSFGAQTTQAVAGQTAALGGQRFVDSRIKAAVIMSPSLPKAGSAERAFGNVKLPWLLMTGTLDTSPIGGQTVESRRGVFPALTPGDKYELVLDKAEHSAFTERALPGDKQPRNPNHHRVILALSTAFWDAYLRDDRAAKAWLDGTGPNTVLQAGDVWQKK